MVLAILLIVAPLRAEPLPPCPFGPGDFAAATLPPGITLIPEPDAPTPTDDVVVGRLSLPSGRLVADGIIGGSEDALPVYRQRYSLFLGPALGFLALGAALPEALPRRPRKEKKR